MFRGLHIRDRGLPIRRFAVSIAALVAALGSCNAAFAQSCPACYANAAAQTPGMLQALKTGILVMMFPSLLMFIVIFAVMYRRRESFYEEGGEELESSPECHAARSEESRAGANQRLRDSSAPRFTLSAKQGAPQNDKWADFFSNLLER